MLNVMLCYVMLCYVMLCYVMLCYVMLCYVMLCYVMLCYFVVWCGVVCCVVLFCAVLCLLFTYRYGNPLCELFLLGDQDNCKDGKGKNVYKFGMQTRKLKNYRIYAETNDYTTREWINYSNYIVSELGIVREVHWVMVWG